MADGTYSYRGRNLMFAPRKRKMKEHNIALSLIISWLIRQVELCKVFQFHPAHGSRPGEMSVSFLQPFSLTNGNGGHLVLLTLLEINRMNKNMLKALTVRVFFDSILQGIN